MASRGRHVAQARDDEQRREERGKQQALAPQGPTVLPPPPPMDYGMFMQGLVQAIQTQTQTQAALQAQLQAQAQAPAPVPQEHGHGGPSIMERLKRMAPPSFKGESRPLLAERREPMFGGPSYYVPGTRMVPLRFAELSTYAPHIVADECKKAKKFVMGLNPSLRSRLVAFDHRTLDETLSVACSGSYQSAGGYATVTRLQAQRQEDVSSLWKGTRWHQVLEAGREVSQVWQHRASDYRFPQTPAGCLERSTSPSSGSSTSDRETRKASSPSSSVRVCIEDRGLFGCFYLLKMKDYDAILGLDLLEEHYA
ncbi:hypothetical protein Taro_037404 [Colocasia esculenta]|uniref:Uncharacterized protein n=1 Tax=Colocasia esculenta TaxID=4460 RepID=A0A843WB07_COLES|nr:hypothetical protein [Colocasia esculenta]